MTTIYDLEIESQTGQTTTLSPYKGKVLLIVNTATGCGLTPQYQGLQQLYDQYKQNGLEILDFPCNQFKNQAPESDQEINSFCTLNYQTTFPRFKKVEVNGDNACPLFTWLKDEKPGLTGKTIKWNFTKFLVDRQGKVIKRFGPQTEPAKLAKDIQILLKQGNNPA